MSKITNDGGPAFPYGQISEATGQPINGYFNAGMTLRDYFAGQALAGFILRLNDPEAFKAFRSLQKSTGMDADTMIAHLSFDQADTMLAVREARA